MTLIGKVARRFAPRLLWRYRVRKWHIAPPEQEVMLLPRLTDRRKLSIDVGAARGDYTAHLIPLSRRVVAFEPTPRFAEALRQQFSDTALVTIEQVALSDRSGFLNMRVPKDSLWRATIDDQNTLAYSTEVETISVAVRALDEYGFRDVGFLKIDVEGHEFAVLRGASQTIHRERPNVLVEVEEQHRPGALEDTFGFFEGAGYSGTFLLDGELRPLAEFDRRIHQNLTHLDSRGEKTDRYINNFLFVSPTRVGSRWLHRYFRYLSRRNSTSAARSVGARVRRVSSADRGRDVYIRSE